MAIYLHCQSEGEIWCVFSSFSLPPSFWEALLAIFPWKILSESSKLPSANFGTIEPASIIVRSVPVSFRADWPCFYELRSWLKLFRYFLPEATTRRCPWCLHRQSSITRIWASLFSAIFSSSQHFLSQLLARFPSSRRLERKSSREARDECNPSKDETNFHQDVDLTAYKKRLIQLRNW